MTNEPIPAEEISAIYVSASGTLHVFRTIWPHRKAERVALIVGWLVVLAVIVMLIC